MAALQSSNDRDGLFQQALSLMSAQRVTDALMVLGRLEQLHPRYSRLYQEKGLCHVALRDVPQAIDAFRHAVDLNPALPDSWDMLQRLYRITGDTNSAGIAAAHLAALGKLPAAVVKASGLLADGDLSQAENLVRDFLRQDGGNVGALRMLARILMDRQALDEAEPLLARVLELAPDFHAARLDYATVLLQQMKFPPARQQAEALLKHEPGNREYIKLLGSAYIGMGDHEPIIGLYGKLLAGMLHTGAEAAYLHVHRGNAFKITGRQPEAIAAYRAALAAQPDHGVAWFSLANLKTYRFTAQDITRMQAAESAAGTPVQERCYLSFALGKALEDEADHAASWRYYERGNALKAAQQPYGAERDESNARRLRQVCTREFFEGRRGWGRPDPDPIFILGLPRSGSTLIEQILASHPQIEGTHELLEIGRYADGLCRPEAGPDARYYPEVLSEPAAEDFRRLGERYLAETRAYRTQGRPFFIDKMPHNMWHIGLIHLMLPNAKIIDARREPMACCFGNFIQLFGAGTQEFSYRLGDLAHHYRTYLGLMRHWKAVLPERILTVCHEDVVEDLEGSVRRILDFCGLPFEPACLEFHRTRRSVRTVSSEQVRQPINRDGMDRWRNYEAWLGPLKDALGDTLTTWRD